ncbi:MAG TPA: hypothetical protein VHV47_10815, partial [Opitutaceae bacterium]|nr:hypothetical protein [Opitutaceae bacterium]
MIRPLPTALVSCAVLAFAGVRLGAQPSSQPEPIPPQTFPASDADQAAADAKPDTNTKVFTSPQVGH